MPWAVDGECLYMGGSDPLRTWSVFDQRADRSRLTCNSDRNNDEEIDVKELERIR